MDFSIVTYFRPAKSVIPFNKSKRAFCMAESWIGLCNRFMAESPHLRVVVCTPLARRDGNLATRFFFFIHSLFDSANYRRIVRVFYESGSRWTMVAECRKLMQNSRGDSVHYEVTRNERSSHCAYPFAMRIQKLRVCIPEEYIIDVPCNGYTDYTLSSHTNT